MISRYNDSLQFILDVPKIHYYFYGAKTINQTNVDEIKQVAINSTFIATPYLP